MTDRARIVFVDDEANVLRGLRRAMQEMADQWDMVFCDGGAAALEEMARQPADVVVSDMRMPQMDGARLLAIVRQRHPATVRVILSGFAEVDSIMKTVDVAHIYLAKPCQPDQLRAAVGRPLALRRMLSEPALRDAVGGVANLPTIPDLFSRIDAELRSGAGSAASVAELLSRDVAMTAEILKLTNSAFFGLGGKVTSVLQAVRTLGLETIRALVLQVGLFRHFLDAPDANARIEALNAFSLVLGRLTEALARDLGIDDDGAQTARCAGMLSSIGFLVMMDRQPHLPPPTSEVAVLAPSYHKVGGYLLGLWGFDDKLVEAVAFADRPREAPGGGSPFVMALHVASALGPRLPLLSSEGGRELKLDMAYLVEARQDKHLRRWRELALSFRHEG